MDLKVCRLCGGIEQLQNILDQDAEIVDKLNICTNINIHAEDLLPKLICVQCNKNLDICYRLRKQSDATQKRLSLEIQRKKCESSNELQDVNNILDRNRDKEELNCANNELVEILEKDIIGLKREISPSTILDKVEKQDETNYDDEGTSALCYNDSNSLNVVSKNNCENELKEITIVPVASGCSIDLLSTSESSADDSYDVLKSEVDELSNVKALTCDTCHEVFIKKTEYRIHIKQHGTERYQCIQCCKFFPSRSRLKRHEETHNEIPCHPCSYCNRNYRALYNLRRHIQSAHLGKNSWECNICNISFSRLDVLKRHLQLHSDEKNYKCALCSQSFKTRDYLYAHHKTHHTPNSEISKTKKNSNKNNANKNQCGYCGKLFKSSFAYKNHLLIHTNEKPYKCESCKKDFRTIAALTTHERIHNDYRPYQCDFCLKSFKQMAHLKEHKLLHSDNAPQYVCTVCQASFLKKSNLKAHTRLHTKEKPFKCADCLAEFSYMHLLQRHASKVHKRSVNEAYTLTDTSETLEPDSEDNKNGTLETEEYHYIDTVAVDDELDNDIGESEIVDISSPEEDLVVESQIEQLSFDDISCAAPNSEPTDSFIPIHSLNSLLSQPSDEDFIEEINDDSNHINEQKFDIFDSEETQMTSSVFTPVIKNDY